MTNWKPVSVSVTDGEDVVIYYDDVGQTNVLNNSFKQEFEMAEKLTAEEFREQEEKLAEAKAEFEAADTYKVVYFPSITLENDVKVSDKFPFELRKKEWIRDDPYYTDLYWRYVSVCGCSSLEDAKQKAKIDSEFPQTFEV